MNLQQLADKVAELEARLAKLEAIALGPYGEKSSADATGQSGDDQPPHK